MKYLLNSAVITAPGDYRYKLLSVPHARRWYHTAEYPESTIGYPETAIALGELIDASVLVNRKTITMATGDEALVFRLVYPPGTQRIAPDDKGALGKLLLAKHYELGFLVRLT